MAARFMSRMFAIVHDSLGRASRPRRRSSGITPHFPAITLGNRLSWPKEMVRTPWNLVPDNPPPGQAEARAPIPPRSWAC